MTPTKWDLRFLDGARRVAGWSKDPSTKVGAIMAHNLTHRIQAVGFNGFPAGMSDDPALYADRATKYARIIHAEMNALLHMTEPVTVDTTLYTWPLPPCDRCMVHMIQAGIRRVVAKTPTAALQERWEESYARSAAYLAEVGGHLLLL
jgi:dCMP deaminase